VFQQGGRGGETKKKKNALLLRASKRGCLSSRGEGREVSQIRLILLTKTEKEKRFIMIEGKISTTFLAKKEETVGYSDRGTKPRLNPPPKKG